MFQNECTMRLKFSLLILFFVPLLLEAQHSANIKGVVADSTGVVLAQASIILKRDGENKSFSKAISGTDGSFNFQSIPKGNYNITYSYEGYNSTSRKFTITDSTTTFHLPLIKLYQSYSELDEVVVISSPPIVIKGDTTEFNVAHIGVKPNANAGDILKKISGIEVDKDGTIKSNGEQVKRVYVDGKRFFGDDTKLTTENLPSDVIDKIQIYDAKSDHSDFTGFDDGNTTKSINIITKKSFKNQGSFGKITAGAGIDKLYATGGNYFRFRNEEQISVVGQINNTNQQMFTLPSGMRGGNNTNPTGQTRTIASGVNYRNAWKKTELYGDYFYNNMNKEVSQYSLKRTLLPNDSIQNTTINNNALTKNINHRFNVNIEHKFDSSNTLIIRPSFNYQNTQNESLSNTTIGRYFGNDTSTISKSQRNNSSRTANMTGSIDLTYRHKFKKIGRTITVSSSVNGGSNNTDGNNYNSVKNLITNKYTITNQFSSTLSNNFSTSNTITYTEPIAKNQQLQLTLGYNYSKSNANRETFNFDSTTMRYSNPDSILINRYINTYAAQIATIGYLLRSDDNKLYFNVSAGVQFGQQARMNETKHLSTSPQYINLYPTASLFYKFSNSKNLRIRYSGRTVQPSISQLQPVLNNANQLNIIDGNPDLKQSFVNSINLRYSAVERASNRNMFAMLNASQTNNAIVNAITQLNNGGQYTHPINMNGTYSLNGFFVYGFPIKTPKSNFNISTDITHAKTVSMINQQVNYTYNTSIGGSLRWNTNLQETFDINIATKPNYTWATYSLNKSQNGNYFSQSVSLDGTWFTKSGWITSINFDYTFYKGLNQNLNISIPLLGASISKQIFKDKSGEIKLSAFDLLNQNKSITNTHTDNYINTTQTNVLQRYFMLSFIYNLKNFSGEQPRTNERRRYDNSRGSTGRGFRGMER